MLKAYYFKYLYLSPLVLFIYMPFHIFLSQWLSMYTGGLDGWKLWKDIFTTLVTILFIVTVYTKRKQTKLYNIFLGLLILYGLLHLILLKTSHVPTDTGLLGAVYNLRIFAYMLIGYSLALLVPKTDHLRKYVRILIILSTVVSILAVLQRVLPNNLLEHFGYSIPRGVRPNFFIDNKPDLPRVFSTLRDPNSLGAFLILPITLLVQALVRNWRTQKRMMISGLLILNVLALLLTFSRSTLLATILALVSLAAIQNISVIKQHRKKLAIAGLIFIAAFGLLFAMTRNTYVVENVVYHADESTVLTDPNELRIQFYQRALEKIADQPFGHGPGTAGLVSIRLGSGVFLTENYYLQIAYEVGIAGFIVFLALLYFILKNLWIHREDYFVKCLLASFAGLAFACLLFHTFSSEAVALPWFMLAGLALSPVYASPPRRRVRKAS